MTSKLNLGILAHVDAGKTTVTEQMLFHSGAIRTMGSVDKGTSATDSLGVERERGISVRLATATLEWQDCQIHLIDTPGHVDFCAEVERSLRALDAALLVVCGMEGVQAFTMTLFEALRSLNIPTMIFINKLDRAGADLETVVEEIHRELSPNCVLLQEAEGQGASGATIHTIWNENRQDETLCEAIVETDDDLLAQFLEGESLAFQALNQALMRATAKSTLFPVVAGVAKSGVGITELLDALVTYLPQAEDRSQMPFSAVVFKIEHDKVLGKMAYLRLFAGKLAARVKVFNATRDKEEKAGQLKGVVKGKYLDKAEVSAGDIAVVSGLTFAGVGDVYGDSSCVPQPYVLSAPLLTTQIRPKQETQLPQLVQALGQLADEDPTLAVEWLAEQREIHLNITGWIQVEVLEAVLLERFGLEVNFDKPSVIYKETPSKSGFGFERYWMPKPCWAILKLAIEPGPPGSGVIYGSELSQDHVALRYQNEIKNTIPKAVKQGVKGWEVTDIRITLIEGEDHNVHTRPGDFITATPMALMNGLVETGTTLLEPILSFNLSGPTDLLGTITSDITKMRGSFESPEMVGERFTLKGKLPAATSMDYPVQLASRSGSKAKIATRLASYEPCTDEQGEITPYRGISPLDREKWILQARGALKR